MNGRWAAAAAAALVAILLHLPILGHEFVWDDAEKFGQARWDGPQDLIAAVTPSYWSELSHEPPEAGYYRPLASLLFAANQARFGLDARIYHAQSILLHGLVTACVVLLAGPLLGAGVPAALAGGLLFAVHPIHTETVAFASDLTDLLAAFFYLGALALALRGRDSWPRALAAGGLWLLALGSKEMALSLPLLVGFAGWISTGRIVRQRWRFWCSALVILVLYAALRSWIFGDFSAAGAELAWEGPYLRLTEVGRALSGALRMLLAPWPLVADYGPAGAQLPAHPIPAGAALLILAAGAAALRARRPAPELAFAAGWFLITLLPVMNLIPIPQPHAERFLYLPSAGPCIALAAGLARMRGRVSWIVAAWLALPVAAGALATTLRLPDWKNEETLWTSVLAVLPENPRALQNLGAVHEGRGDLEQATLLYEHAHRLAPRMEKVTTAYAGALYGTGRIDEAITVLEEHALRYGASAAVAGRLGAALARRRDFEAALRYFQIAARLAPESGTARSSLIRCLIALGRLDDARQELDRIAAQGVSKVAIERLDEELRRARTGLESPGGS